MPSAPALAGVPISFLAPPDRKFSGDILLSDDFSGFEASSEQRLSAGIADHTRIAVNLSARASSDGAKSAGEIHDVCTGLLVVTFRFAVTDPIQHA
jgi:hypothetical protein